MYRTIVADPPWFIGRHFPTGAAVDHYPLMPMEQLYAFELPPLERDSILFLWRLSSMQEDALRLCRAWGFSPKTELVWIKKTSKGNRHFGQGTITRAEHETCLIAVRGRTTPNVKAQNIRSTFEAPVGKHSKKPDKFYELVEELTPGPYVELFARRERPGWACFGNELPRGEPR